MGDVLSRIGSRLLSSHHSHHVPIDAKSCLLVSRRPSPLILFNHHTHYTSMSTDATSSIAIPTAGGGFTVHQLAIHGMQEWALLPSLSSSLLRGLVSSRRGTLTRSSVLRILCSSITTTTASTTLLRDSRSEFC